MGARKGWGRDHPKGKGSGTERASRPAPLRSGQAGDAPGREAVADDGLSGLPLSTILKGLVLGEALPGRGGLRTEIDLGGRPLEQDLQEEAEG
jgi:hypothetical protein